MEFTAFLVIYAVVVGASLALRHVANKREKAKAKAEEATERPKQRAARTVSKPQRLAAVSSFQTRMNGSEKNPSNAAPAFNINDEGSMATALGYRDTGAYLQELRRDDTDVEEDVVLGSHR